MTYAIAVIDIGKTNKKILIYDDALTALESRYRSFPPRFVDGLELEDLSALEAWIVESLAEFGSRYPIRIISVTTHGAAFVCTDESGAQCVPMVSYTHEPGDAFHREFFELAGDPGELQRTTATAELGALINVAKGIFFHKKTFPREFARTKHLLLYPQYWGIRFTGRPAAEHTYVGCHTYLWDFGRKTWSSVTEKLGVRELLPEDLSSTWDMLGPISPEFARRTGLAPETLVTMGIHDSNSSLLPYLLKQREAAAAHGHAAPAERSPFAEHFILNSTGTWCVLMHPMNEVYFTDDEIGKVVFYNLSAYAEPVKTAIFLGGLEFETYSGILRKLHGDLPYPEFDPDRVRCIIDERRLFILPGVVQGTGQFPVSKPRIVEDGRVYALEDVTEGRAIPEFFLFFATACSVLNLSLGIQTAVALERVGHTEGTSVYVEGGFRKNREYNLLLADFLPGSEVALTNIEEATSLGAALLANIALAKAGLAEGRTGFSIEYQPVAGAGFRNIKRYAEAFMNLL